MGDLALRPVENENFGILHLARVLEELEHFNQGDLRVEALKVLDVSSRQNLPQSEQVLRVVQYLRHLKLGEVDADEVLLDLRVTERVCDFLRHRVDDHHARLYPSDDLVLDRQLQALVVALSEEVKPLAELALHLVHKLSDVLNNDE